MKEEFDGENHSKSAKTNNFLNPVQLEWEISLKDSFMLIPWKGLDSHGRKLCWELSLSDVTSKFSTLTRKI